MVIKDKVALVTGAGQGIGRGIALRLAKDGARTLPLSISKKKRWLRSPKRSSLWDVRPRFCCDVTSRDQVYAAVDHAEKELDGFDIMVNNAGSLKSSRWLKSHPRKWKLFSK